MLNLYQPLLLREHALLLLLHAVLLPANDHGFSLLQLLLHAVLLPPHDPAYSLLQTLLSPLQRRGLPS